MNKQITQDVILVIIVLAGIVSFFYNPLGGESIKYLQILMGGIVGFYTGIKELPIARGIKR